MEIGPLASRLRLIAAMDQVLLVTVTVSVMVVLPSVMLMTRISPSITPVVVPEMTSASSSLTSTTLSAVIGVLTATLGAAGSMVRSRYVVVVLPTVSLPVARTLIVPLRLAVVCTSHVPPDCVVAWMVCLSLQSPSKLGSISTVMSAPAGKSVVPLMSGVQSGERLPDVKPKCGGEIYTISVCTSLPVLPAVSVALSSIGSVPFYPPAGRLPLCGSAVARSIDHEPLDWIAVLYTRSYPPLLSVSKPKVNSAPAGKPLLVPEITG